MVNKQKSAKSKRRPLFLLLALIIVLVLSGSAYALYRHNNQQTSSATTTAKTSSGRPVNSVNYAPSSKSDNVANNQRKASSTPADTLDNGPTTTTNSSLSAQIVSASANNGNIHIGTMVSGATSGTCKITATQGHTTVTLASAPVKLDVNSYDCGGSAINVSTSQLNPSTGTWQLKLTVTAGSSQATDTASVTL